jgi:tetratricopeptide (TPR) repeat protein
VISSLTMRGWLVAALIATFLGSAPARAGEDEDRAAKARARYETGMAHFNLEEWDQAIAEWEAGYRIKPVPEFLFNIAQAYRKSARHERALTFYQRYLRLAPKAENRDEVEKQIALLQKIVEDEKRNPPHDNKPKPSPPPLVVEPTPPAPVVAPPVAATAPSTEVRPELVARAPERRPVYKKPWFWIVTVGAVAVVGAGVAVGVIYGTKDNTKILPPATFQ